MKKLSQRNRTLLGFSIGIIGIVGFFFLGTQMNMFGSKIDYLSITQPIPFLFVLIGFYGFGFIGSHKQGLTMAGVWGVMFFIAWLGGYIQNVIFAS